MERRGFTINEPLKQYDISGFKSSNKVVDKVKAKPKPIVNTLKPKKKDNSLKLSQMTKNRNYYRTKTYYLESEVLNLRKEVTKYKSEIERLVKHSVNWLDL